MIVDPKALKDAGYSQEKLKKLFTDAANPKLKKPSEEVIKVKSLIELHAHRIDDGIRRSLSHARYTKAVDDACDVAKNQITYTLVRGLIDRNKGKSDAENLIATAQAASELGLDSLLVPMVDTQGRKLSYDGRLIKNSDTKPGYKINLPVFFNVYMPVVMTYVKTRQASLFGEIDLDPFFKYEPHVLGPKDRALAKIITRRVERMVTDSGVRQAVRQSILQTLKYGMCLNFPQNQWWSNKQKIGGKEKVVEEGIVYETPHMARTFFDPNHPPYTLNTNTGCEYAGYWTMKRYTEVAANKDWWNTDQVNVGAGSWRTTDGYNLFTKIYPCVLQFPDFRFTSGTGDNNRDNKAFFYAKENHDAGVDLVVKFHRLVPKDWGLYDYEYPVWHRFVYAGDRTVIHCEPWLYHPVVADLYDNDAQADMPISLGLEAIPHQDHFGNLLTQMMLTTKKNLIRILGVNKDAVSKEQIDKIINNSENAVRGIEVFEFSGRQLEAQQLKFNELFVPMQTPQMSIGEQVVMLNTMISFIERVLGFSPQELGASQSHQISAAEAKITAASTMSRRGLTASYIQDAQFTRKRQHYDAFMAHGDDQILVEVANLENGQIDMIKEAGLNVTEVDGRPGAAVIKGSKANLNLDAFISSRDGGARSNDPQVAQLMLTVLDRIAANPALAQLVGTDKIVKIYNTAAQFLGLPEESYLSADKASMPATTPEEQQQLLQGVQQLIGQQLEQLGQSVLAPLAEKQQQAEQAIGQIVAAQEQANQQVGQAITQVAQTNQQQDAKIQALATNIAQLSQKLSQMLQLIVQPAEQQMAPQVVP